MSLWAIKNDEGKYQTECAGDLWRELGDDTEVYGEKFDAMEDAREFGGHVVELAEKSAPIVVSEDEDKVLKKAKNTTVWRPASVIAGYAYEHEQQGDDEVLLEDRLMRAYVNGWTVAKPKRYLIKVPHTDDSYFYKIDDEYCNAGDSYHLEGMTDNKWFTAAEIEHYGLQDCEKLEVTQDGE